MQHNLQVNLIYQICLEVSRRYFVSICLITFHFKVDVDQSVVMSESLFKYSVTNQKGRDITLLCKTFYTLGPCTFESGVHCTIYFIHISRKESAGQWVGEITITATYGHLGPMEASMCEIIQEQDEKRKKKKRSRDKKFWKYRCIFGVRAQ